MPTRDPAENPRKNPPRCLCGARYPVKALPDFGRLLEPIRAALRDLPRESLPALCGALATLQAEIPVATASGGRAPGRSGSIALGSGKGARSVPRLGLSPPPRTPDDAALLRSVDRLGGEAAAVDGRAVVVTRRFTVSAGSLALQEGCAGEVQGWCRNEVRSPFGRSRVDRLDLVGRGGLPKADRLPAAFRTAGVREDET